MSLSKAAKRRITRQCFQDLYATCKRNNTMPMYYGAVLRYGIKVLEQDLPKIRRKVEHLEQLVNNLKDQDNELQSK